jgi:phage baseplate assembly protein gpV
MIEEMLSSVDQSIDELKKKFYGVTTGRVINPLDPLMLGRVQVQLPFIDALDLSPWARVVTPMAGQLAGNYFIPNVGDEVLVAFEHGDVNAPYVIGCLWTAIAPPPMPSPLPQVRAIRTLTGNQIVFTEAPPSVTIQTAPTPPVVMPSPPAPTGPYQTISMNPAGVQVATPIMMSIMVGATTSVIVTPGAVNVQVGSATLAITPGAIAMHAPTISLVADGKVTIAGALVTIN